MSFLRSQGAILTETVFLCHNPQLSAQQRAQHGVGWQEMEESWGLECHSPEWKPQGLDQHCALHAPTFFLGVLERVMETRGARVPSWYRWETGH